LRKNCARQKKLDISKKKRIESGTRRMHVEGPKRNHVGGLKRSGLDERRKHVAKGKKKRFIAKRKKKRPVANRKRNHVGGLKRSGLGERRKHVVEGKKKRPVANRKRRLIGSVQKRKKLNEGGKLSSLASRHALSRRLPMLLSLVLNLRRKKPSVAGRKKQILRLRGVHRRKASENTGLLRNGDSKKN
jgi:hypothetical protein